MAKQEASGREEARSGEAVNPEASLVDAYAALAARCEALERTRDALVEQERLRAIGEIASGVAHDLNNTLHALVLRLARLRDDEPAPARAANLDAIDRIVRDAATRVRRLQDLARSREDVPIETLDLRDVLAEAIAIARPQLRTPDRGGSAEIALTPRVAALPRVVGSATDLHHVFLGLFVNARDAMPAGGRVTVDGEADGDRVAIRVADEGSGIDPALLGRVFDPFFTTKGRRGTGLGLSIAAGVMRRLGGTIEAANRPGRGAVFTLRFPRAPDDRPAPLPPPAATAPAPSMLRVLVVDDDEDNLDASRWTLEHLGQSVEVAASGQDALGRVGAGERYDLVLCDLGMPGLDGWQVTAGLRRTLPDARIYLLTGWAEQLDPRDPRRASLDGVLPKPLGVDALERLLHAGRPSDPHAPAAR